MGASLFNSSNNALLISCIQSSVMDQFKRAIREADYDRIAQREETLNPLDKNLAHSLIRSRLDSNKDLARLRSRHSQQPLWPIEPLDLDPVFPSSGAATARKIISFAGALFDKLQTGGSVPLQDSSEFLTKEFERRRDMAFGQDEAESDMSLAHGLPLLAERLGGQWRQQRQPHRDIDLLLSHGDKRIAVSLCNHQNMRSLAARLKRLMDWHSRSKGVEMVLIRDGRLPISRTAVVTRSRLDSLVAKGVSVCRPDMDTLAALQALRSLISDARSGDLHDGGEAIGPKRVEEWLFQNLDSRLTALFGQIVGPSETPEEADSEVMNSILDVLKKHKVIELEKLAEETGQAVLLIEDAVKRHPGRIGWLQGPPPVLFDYRPVEILSSREEDEE
jgi:hypothetical protein